MFPQLMTVIGIPLVVAVISGVIKWILAQRKPIRDYFLLGTDLSLSSLALCFATIFGWIRKAVLDGDGGDSNSDNLLYAVTMALASVVALLFVIAIMGAYVNKEAPEGQPSIGWVSFWFVNILGGVPLGVSAALLLEIK